MSNYFVIAPEIPSELFEEPIPERSFFVQVSDPHSVERIGRTNVRPLTLRETLWALGFMNCELAEVIGIGSVRFLHEPFAVRMEGVVGPDAVRRLLVRRTPTGYAIETFPSNTPPPTARVGCALAL